MTLTIGGMLIVVNYTQRTMDDLNNSKLINVRRERAFIYIDD